MTTVDDRPARVAPGRDVLRRGYFGRPARVARSLSSWPTALRRASWSRTAIVSRTSGSRRTRTGFIVSARRSARTASSRLPSQPRQRPPVPHPVVGASVRKGFRSGCYPSVMLTAQSGSPASRARRTRRNPTKVGPNSHPSGSVSPSSPNRLARSAAESSAAAASPGRPFSAAAVAWTAVSVPHQTGGGGGSRR
jgi:hypothetical protein